MYISILIELKIPTFYLKTNTRTHTYAVVYVSRKNDDCSEKVDLYVIVLFAERLEKAYANS